MRRDRAVETLLAGYATLETVRGVAPELLAVIASVAVGVGLTPPLVGAALTVGFLFVAFYTFTPDVYPAAVGPRRERPGFRLLVSVVALTVAVPATVALTMLDTPPVSYATVAGYLCVVLVGGAAAFTAYFRLTQSRPLSDPESDAFAILRTRVDDTASDHRRYLRRLDSRAPWAGAVVRWLSVPATMATYLGPAVLFGLGAATLDSLFPLLEVVVVLALLVRAGRRMGVLDRSVPDVESRFYDRLTAATRSTRGTAGVFMVLLALVFATFLISVWLRVGTEAWLVTNDLDAVRRSLGPSPIARPLHVAVADLVAGIGMVVALPAASGYAIWYWLCELRRFAAFEGEGSTTPPVARPAGLLAAPTAMTVCWFAALTAHRSPWPVESAFAVAWPPLALVLLVRVHRTRRAAATPPSETRWTIPAAFVLYVGGAAASLVVFLDLRATLLLAIVFPTWLFYLDRASGDVAGVRDRLRVVGYGMALLAGVFAFRTPLDVGPAMLAALAGIIGLLTVGQAFGYAFDPDRGDRTGSG